MFIITTKKEKKNEKCETSCSCDQVPKKSLSAKEDVDDAIVPTTELVYENYHHFLCQNLSILSPNKHHYHQNSQHMQKLQNCYKQFFENYQLLFLLPCTKSSSQKTLILHNNSTNQFLNMKIDK